ncbi:MAG: FGGY family carbohydrate kinase, partial [Actinomycetota bacterium]
MTEVTVGIDIGTSSVKAIAADGDGNVVARARVPHPFSVPTPDRFEHDAALAWREGPQRALDALGDIAPRIGREVTDGRPTGTGREAVGPIEEEPTGVGRTADEPAAGGGMRNRVVPRRRLGRLGHAPGDERRAEDDEHIAGLLGARD